MQDLPRKSIAQKPDDDAMVFCDVMAQTVFDSLSAHIAILDETGTILDTNRAWRRFAAQNGMPADYDPVGNNYLTTCDQAGGTDQEDAHSIARGIRQVIAGTLDEFLYDYPCHSDTQRRWYYMRAICIPTRDPVRVVISHEEITPLKLAEEALRESREALQDQKQSLEEANIALKVLLKQREEDRRELEKKVLTNVKELVLPYIEKLQHAPLKAREKTLVEIAATHLNDVISPFLRRLSNANILLTPQEMQVAALVKDGKPSKEIAEILNISGATVNFHRKNLRAKFKLTRRQTNLRAYLMTLSDR